MASDFDVDSPCNPSDVFLGMVSDDREGDRKPPQPGTLVLTETQRRWLAAKVNRHTTPQE